MRLLSVTLVAFFAFFQVVKCGDMHGSPWSRRHNSNVDVAARQNTALEKRDRFTFYTPGLGACGIVNKNADFVVALNSIQFKGGAYCFKTITITINGKTAQAQIVDECMACDYGGLDFSGELFNFFGPQTLGVLSGSWVFDGAASSSTKSTLTPKSTSTYQPPSSTSSVTQYTTSNSTSTQTPTPTSTQSSASISSPTPLIPSQEAGNIANLFLTFIQVESILAVAHGS